MLAQRPSAKRCETWVSSCSERDTPKRDREHDDIVDAAIEAGVETWYVNLAFGGWGDGSKVDFMQAHLRTEERLVG